jgi:hypothetical protein
MADPASRADAPSDRRDRRRHRSRRRVRSVAVVVASIVGLVGFVLVATDSVRFGGGDRPSLAGTVPAGRDAAPTPTSTTTAVNRCRTLTVDDPLRVWVGGDSLAGSLGPSLGAIAGATGVAQPYFDSRVSSGLGNPGFFNWPDHAATEMTRLTPEITVFIIGANDWDVPGGNTWQAQYTQRVDTMMKTLIGTGRTVYWLGSPPLKDDKMNAAVVQVDSVAQSVARQHPEVHYVDTYKLFAGPDGKFAADLPDETGKIVTMRAGDGVHLTTNGADYLARTVYKQIDAQCDLTGQKVAGVTKATIQTEGSTQVAPGATGSTPPAPGGTIATTPPATAPRTATAPSTTQPTTAVPTTPTTPRPTTTPPPISIPQAPTNG